MVAFGHIGKTVTFKVIRQGKTMEIKALVEKRPEKLGTTRKTEGLEPGVGG